MKILISVLSFSSILLMILLCIYGLYENTTSLMKKDLLLAEIEQLKSEKSLLELDHANLTILISEKVKQGDEIQKLIVDLTTTCRDQYLILLLLGLFSVTAIAVLATGYLNSSSGSGSSALVENLVDVGQLGFDRLFQSHIKTLQDIGALQSRSQEVNYSIFQLTQSVAKLTDEINALSLSIIAKQNAAESLTEISSALSNSTGGISGFF